MKPQKLQNKHTSHLIKGVRAGKAGVCILFVVINGLRINYAVCAHRMSQLYVNSHWQKKDKAKDWELEELKAETKQAGEIMTVT